MKTITIFKPQRLAMFIFAYFVLAVTAAGDVFTYGELEDLRRQETKDKLKQARKKYPIQVVEVLPMNGVRSFFDIFETDEELIGFLKGQYVICSDAKKVIYMTPTMIALHDGTIEQELADAQKKAEYEYRLKMFEYRLGMLKAFSKKFHSIASEKDIVTAMGQFSTSFQKEFLNPIKANKNSLESQALLLLAERSGMTKVGEFKSLYNKLIDMQTKRLSASRPEYPDPDASEEEIEAYNQEARQYIENRKKQKAEMDKIIHSIGTVYGANFRDAVISTLREMRDESDR